MFKGRTPLRQLRKLRGACVFLPIITTMVTVPSCLGPNPPGPRGDIAAELRPIALPMLIGAGVFVLLLRMVLSPEAPRFVRVTLISLAWIGAMLAGMAAGIFGVNGGGMPYVVAGLLLPMVAGGMLNIDKYAHDVPDN